MSVGVGCGVYLDEDDASDGEEQQNGDERRRVDELVRRQVRVVGDAATRALRRVQRHLRYDTTRGADTSQLIAKFHYADPTGPGSPTKSADIVWSGTIGPV